MNQQIQQAIAEYQRAKAATHNGTGTPDDHYNHGYWAARLGQWQEAIHAYHRALGMGISQPEEAWLNIASIHSERLQEIDKAVMALNEALQLNPDYTPAMFNRGHLAEQIGDRAGAKYWFGEVVKRDPSNEAALARLADATVFERDDDETLVALRSAANDAQNADVWLSLAAAEESLGNYEAAWEAMNAANGIDRAAYPPYPAEKMQELNTLAKQIDIPEQSKGDGPLFICGMFRTGSTLLEQILAAQGDFHPLGESDFWPRRIAGAGGGMVFPAREPTEEEVTEWRAQHAEMLSGMVPEGQISTDKRPDNIYQIHLLGQVLPEARFVITRRDWRDTMVSVFGTRLHPQHGYATDLRAIKEQLRLTNELAEAWSTRYPDRVRVVDYEAVVADPEPTIGELLEWLGQDWNEEALNFHELRNSVRTASVWQVREPLGDHRTQRWRRFESQLRDIFGDELDSDQP